MLDEMPTPHEIRVFRFLGGAPVEVTVNVSLFLVHSLRDVTAFFGRPDSLDGTWGYLRLLDDYDRGAVVAGVVDSVSRNLDWYLERNEDLVPSHVVGTFREEQEEYMLANVRRFAEQCGDRTLGELYTFAQTYFLVFVLETTFFEETCGLTMGEAFRFFDETDGSVDSFLVRASLARVLSVVDEYVYDTDIPSDADLDRSCEGLMEVYRESGGDDLRNFAQELLASHPAFLEATVSHTTLMADYSLCRSLREHWKMAVETKESWESLVLLHSKKLGEKSLRSEIASHLLFFWP